MGKNEGSDNVISFPVGSKEFESAALWLARLERGLSEEEHANLCRLLRSDSAIAGALRELAAFWGELDLLRVLPVFSPSGRRVVFDKLKLPGWRLAAALLVAACGLVALGYTTGFPFDYGAAVAGRFEQTYETSIGERSTERLPDGSVITLNTNTRVRVLYQGRSRLAEMQRGEAHFTVAHDEKRPFGVRVNGRIVQAVGTAFNILLGETGDVEVTVTEGIVQILEDELGVEDNPDRLYEQWSTNSLKGMGLVEGQVALFDDPSVETADEPEITSLQPVDLEIKLAWQRGVLIFEGEELVAVLKEFSRYTTTEFILGSEELAGVRVGGYFRAGDVDGLLLTLKDNFQIEAEHVTANRILLLSSDQ